jgi:hypothetical protein
MVSRAFRFSVGERIMNKLNRRPSFAAMTYDAKRLLSFPSDTKALINISRIPLDKEFKPKSLYLPVLIRQHQKVLLNAAGGSL